MSWLETVLGIAARELMLQSLGPTSLCTISNCYVDLGYS